MSLLQRTAAIALAVLLLVTGYGLWTTRAPPPTAAQPLQPQVGTAASRAPEAMPVIDQQTYLTAQRLAHLPNTPEELPFAQQAVELADHELDLAFTAAMRHLEAQPPALSPDALQIQARLQGAQKALDSDAADVKRLTAALGAAPDADKAPIQDRLDLAQSQLELEQDEVQQANEDLLQAGGNAHQRIQRMQQEHAATERAAAAAAAPAASPLAGVQGMVGKLRQWLALRDKRRWLGEAQRTARESAAQLASQRTQIVADLDTSKAALGRPAPGAPAPPATPAGRPGSSGAGATASLLTLTRQVAAEQHRLTLRDQRIVARQRLANVYRQWDALVAAQARSILHACLAGTAIVLGALLFLLFADRWLERLLTRARIDRRQLQTLRSVIGVALQIVGVVVILLVLVGLPGQLGTMLGLAGAGLTVALKDFIVAFIGWFVLMGRNGVHLGDWVEINGVSGEVIELGMFHTVLLETGNWTDAGHPTGRHVTFTNSFAIEGHYFNFSTTGQWLWDEISVVVPYGRDSHAIAAAIEKEAVAATANSAGEAEAEWRRASLGQRGASVSAAPGVAVRPAGGGVEIVVRYVTRAAERLAVRAQLYQTAVQLLAQSGTARG
jgi:small-conductance mechanosensitive channel